MENRISKYYAEYKNLSITSLVVLGLTFIIIIDNYLIIPNTRYGNTSISLFQIIFSIFFDIFIPLVIFIMFYRIIKFIKYFNSEFDKKDTWKETFSSLKTIYKNYVSREDVKSESKLDRFVCYFKPYFSIITPVFFTILIFAYFEIILLDRSQDADVIFNVPSLIVSALKWGTLFLSLAVGLNLTYKIMGFPNFAHAEYLTIGGFTALFLQTMDTFQPASTNSNAGSLRGSLLLISIIFGFLISGFAAVLFDKLIYKRLRNRNSRPETMMIASLGLALIIRGLLFIRFTGGYQYFDPDQDIHSNSYKIVRYRFNLRLGSNILRSGFEPLRNRQGELQYFSISSYEILVVGLLNLLVILVYIFIQKTKLGKAMRAVSDDPSLAAASGINVENIRLLTWFIGGGLAGVAGVLWAGMFKFTPETGSLFLLAAFAVIVLGTIGSFEGAIIASLLIGFVRVFSETAFTKLASPLNRPQLSTLAEIMPFIILIIVLLFYPEGIGKKIEDHRLEKARARSIGGSLDE